MLREDSVTLFPAEGSAVPNEGGKRKGNNHVLSTYTEHRNMYKSIQAVRIIPPMRELWLREVK